MWIGVVHEGGHDAARRLVQRAIAGEPDVTQAGPNGVVAGWRRAVPLDAADGFVVEGWLDAELGSSTGGPRRVGAEDLRRARGDFALAGLVDGGLVVAPGPGGGHRPVFVVVRRDWAAASTRMRLLLRLLDAPPALDPDYLTASTIIDYPLAPEATPFAGISRVPLGEAWSVCPGAVPTRRVIVDDPSDAPLRGTEADFARALRHAVDGAVARATRGAPKVGVAFSGGLDSSSVLLTLEALRRSGRIAADVEAYSWEFDTPDPADDRPYRRAVERRLGVEPRAVLPESAGAFARRGMVLDAMPCTDTPCGLWLALGRAVRERGVDRLLTGAGGDNVLDGDPALFAEIARRGEPWRALRLSVGFRGMGSSTAWWRFDRFVVRPLIESLLPPAFRQLRRRFRERRWFDWMGPRFDGWLARRDAVHRAVPRLTLESSPADRYRALARMPFLADVALLRAQQEEATQYHRVDPLFDDQVLRLVATLPPLALLAGGYRRGLLRTAMADVLPERLRERPHKAYMEPALARMVQAAGGFDEWRDLVRVRRLADLGIVDPERFRAHFDRLAADPLDALWCSVWPVLATEEFLRQYDEGWAA